VHQSGGGGGGGAKPPVDQPIAAGALATTASSLSAGDEPAPGTGAAQIAAAAAIAAMTDGFINPQPSPRFARKIAPLAVNSLSADDSLSLLTVGHAEAESDPGRKSPARRPVFVSECYGVDSLHDTGLKEAGAVAARGWWGWVTGGVWVVRSAPIRNRRRCWRVASGRPADEGRCSNHKSLVVERRRWASAMNRSRPNRGRCDDRWIHRPHPSPRFARKITGLSVNSLSFNDALATLTVGHAEAESHTSYREPARRSVIVGECHGVDSLHDTGLKEAGSAAVARGWGWMAGGVGVVGSAPVRGRGRWCKAASRPADQGWCAHHTNHVGRRKGGAALLAKDTASTTVATALFMRRN
jgi:hypothetical protein